MASFKKVNSVQEFILNITKDIEIGKKIMLNEISENIRNILYIYTENFYDRYEPDPASYIRTYEFIDSLKVRFVNEDEVEIGFDQTMLTIKQNQNWTQHEDRFYPLSQIINDGWDVRTDGSHALDEAIKYMEGQNFKKEVKDIFLKNGYSVTIK